MCLQTQVIRLYKENHPHDTLKMISKRTGIQITRVFRIFNGSEMKISEYESFHKLLHKEKFNSEIVQLAENCLEKLTMQRNQFIVAQLKHALKLQEMKEQQSSTLPIQTEQQGEKNAI